MSLLFLYVLVSNFVVPILKTLPLYGNPVLWTMIIYSGDVSSNCIYFYICYLLCFAM